MITYENPDWPSLKTWLLAEIESDRTALEQVGVPVNEADAHRGAIAAFRKLIATVDPVPITLASDMEDSSEDPPIYHEA